MADAAVRRCVVGRARQHFRRQRRPRADVTDATSNTGPLLVTGGKVHAGDNVTGLVFTTKDGSDVRFNLNEQLLHALCHLMVTTCQRADWNLDLTLGDPNVVVPTGEALVH